MGLRIEAPKQDGNARFNTLKVNLQQNLSATRGVVADEQGNFYYGVAGSGGAGFPYSGSAQITGSLGVTGSINIIDGGITGSLYGTSSWAISASYVANAPTAETASYVLSSNVDGPLGMDSIVSASYSVSSGNSISASYAFTASSAVSASNSISSSYSETASYAFNAETASFVTASSVFGPYGSSSIESASYAVSTSYTNYAVTASHALTASSADDFLVRGTLTAQTIVAQIITSSTQYITGSTIFGSELTNTHVFTGSVSITGSLDVYGPANFYGPITGSIYGTASYAPNIYNSDGELTGNRRMSGSQYNLALDPSLTFNNSIVGYSRKPFYSNGFSTVTSSFATASVLISANATQSGSFGGLYGLINYTHLIGENQGNSTQAFVAGYQSTTQFTGIYTSSRMYVAGARITVSRFGTSSSLDQSNNGNNFLVGQEIVTIYNGGAGGVTSSYTGQHLALSITNTIVNGNIGSLYGVRVQNNISNFTTYTGSTTTNYYGIKLEASIGTTSAAITTSIQNYYGAHISSLSIGATGRVTNLYGVYAEDSRMAHYFNGNVGIKTNRPAYEIDVVGSGRIQTNSNFGILANPTGTPTATPLTTGGALADGTYYYSITAVDNYFAQTTGSAIATATISGGGGAGSVQLSWTAVAGASYYIIHRGTTLGTYGTSYLSAQLATTFTDVGGASAGYGFPTNNVTAVSQIASNGNLNVGSGLITFGNGTGPPLRTLEIRRLTGFAVPTGIIIGSGNTSFGSAYPNNPSLPFVFGEFNTLTGSRYYVIGDNNNMTAGTAPNTLASLFIGYQNTYFDGVNVTAIGRANRINTSIVDNGCSITIGRLNSLNHRSVVIGTEVESTADGQLVIGQNNPSENLTIRDIYFGNGIRNKFTTVNANFGNGFDVTINGSGPTASADLAGGKLILAGGKGTGAGTPGDLVFSTSTRLASGVTLQSLSQRVWIKGDTGNVGIGTSSPTLANLQVQGNVWALSYTGSLFGTASWAQNAISSSYPIAVSGSTLYSTNPRTLLSGGNTLIDNIFLGQQAGEGAISVNRSNFLGNQAGFSASSAVESNFLGDDAGGFATNAFNSNFLGAVAGYEAANAYRSNFLGDFAGRGAAYANSSNFLGSSAGSTAVSASYSNFLGMFAGRGAKFASHSILIGYNVGRNIDPDTFPGIGANNIILGTNITLADNRSNSINIGGIIFGTGSYSDINTDPYSGSVSGKIGINVINPQYTLDISGSLKVTSSVLLPGLTTSPQSNVITIDTTTGQLYYTASSAVGGGASLSGGDTNYVARWASSTTLTTGSIFDNGTSVGIGTITPTASLHLVGNSDTSSFVFYTEASGSFPLFRIYNSREGISNPGLLTSSFNESFGIGSLMSSSISNNRLFRNVALGAAAMRSGDNIRSSIAIGVSAMLLATASASGITGSIAIGDSALGRQLGGSFNIAIGTNAMLGVSSTVANSGDRNIGIGAASLTLNTTGNRNTATGDSSLGTNSVGQFNTANGARSLIFNTSGSYNVAVGIDALRNNTTASYGTAIGAQALYDNLTGDRNIALGFDSGRGITSGRANTIIGSATGLLASLSNNIILADGDGNIRAWHNAVSWSLSTPVVANDGITGSLFGTSSWAISSSYAVSASNSISSSWAISSSYAVSASNSISSSWAISASWAPNTGGSSQWTSSGANIYFNVGNVGVGTNSPAYPFDVSGNTRLVGSLAVGNITPSGTSGRIDAENDIVAFSSSDIRFKTNLKTIANPIDKINKVSGYEFDWIPDQENHGHEGHDIGVIAQEIEEILPEIVTTRESGYKAVKYEKIVPLLIEAIKEQQKQIEELRYLLQNK